LAYAVEQPLYNRRDKCAKEDLQNGEVDYRAVRVDFIVSWRGEEQHPGTSWGRPQGD
jgi:hypothetical protein